MQRLRLRRRADAELVAQPAAQLLVDEQALRRIPLALERLHQQPVARLAVRLETDERSRRPHRGGELGAADAEGRARVRLERADAEGREARSLRLDPLALLVGQEPAA